MRSPTPSYSTFSRRPAALEALHTSLNPASGTFPYAHGQTALSGRDTALTYILLLS